MPDGNPVLEAKVSLRVASLDLAVSLESSTGRVAVVGPSGAGKSTLLRILAGLEPAARGVVRVRGQTWMDSDSGVRVHPWARGVGWVPQDTLLFPHLSVRENLAYGVPPGDRAVGGGRVRELAELVEASHLLDRRPAVLSGGERQRVALARALLARPVLLLLDEPFSALDRPLRDDLARRLSGYLKSVSLPVVLVSHDEDDAAALGCRELHIVEGRLTG